MLSDIAAFKAVSLIERVEDRLEFVETLVDGVNYGSSLPFSIVVSRLATRSWSSSSDSLCERFRFR